MFASLRRRESPTTAPLELRSITSSFYGTRLAREAQLPNGMLSLNLMERIYDLWEELFNHHAPNQLGRALYNAVNGAIAEKTPLGS